MSCGKSQWEQHCICGVVSLLDMLEFAARPYVELSHRFGILLALVQGTEVVRNRDNELAESLGILFTETERLDLPVTREHLECLMEDMAKSNPQGVKIQRGKHPQIEFVGFVLAPETWRTHIEGIYRTLRAELGSLLLRVIPKEKARYCDPEWLRDNETLSKYPDMIDEFQRAGRCFSYGENTACIFHLMRVADFCFRKVATSLNISYDARSWQEVGHKITSNMEQKYQTKTDDWKRKEPFYAEILTDIQGISRGHRNPSFHELEKKYEEREAFYMLTVMVSFAEHVAKRLLFTRLIRNGDRET
jgi:hypothetical protein